MGLTRTKFRIPPMHTRRERPQSPIVHLETVVALHCPKAGPGDVLFRFRFPKEGVITELIIHIDRIHGEVPGECKSEAELIFTVDGVEFQRLVVAVGLTTQEGPLGILANTLLLVTLADSDVYVEDVDMSFIFEVKREGV